MLVSLATLAERCSGTLATAATVLTAFPAQFSPTGNAALFMCNVRQPSLTFGSEAIPVTASRGQQNRVLTEMDESALCDNVRSAMKSEMTTIMLDILHEFKVWQTVVTLASMMLSILS